MFSNVQVNWENLSATILMHYGDKVQIFFNLYLYVEGQLQTTSFLRQTLGHLFCDCRSTHLLIWNNVSHWTSENLHLTNITPFSPVLCLSLIDNISNLFLHHFFLIARHYTYIYVVANYEILFLCYKCSPSQLYAPWAFFFFFLFFSLLLKQRLLDLTVWNCNCLKRIKKSVTNGEIMIIIRIIINKL